MGVDVPAATRLGVDHLQQPDIGQRELAGIDDFDRDDVVTVSERLHLALPSRGSEEVGQHDDEAATMSEAAGAAERLAQPQVRVRSSPDG